MTLGSSFGRPFGQPATHEPSLASRLGPSGECQAQEERAWLVEEDAGGFIHWMALAHDGWPRTKSKLRRTDFEFEEYLSPVRRVKDANEALRFARQEDAEAFIKLFDRFLLNAIATEHSWPPPPTRGRGR